MPLVPVPEQSEIPEFPSLAYRALGTYNTMAYDWANRWRAVVAPELHQFALAAYGNAQYANQRAGQADVAANKAFDEAVLSLGYRNQAGGYATAASTSASNAQASAQAAETSRVEASKLNLGNKAAPPALDNQGQPLRAGSTYYDTALNKWRVWTGTAWGDGISAVAGVSQVNGKAGEVTLSLLDLQPAASLGNVDLNTVLQSGDYTFATPANGPAGLANGALLVSRAAGVLSQIATDPATGLMWVRTATGAAGAPTYSPWRRVALQNDVAIALAGGPMDCAKGDYFTETVSAARMLAFANIPAAPYACTLEINHTAGAITLPAGSVWVGGTAPTLATGKRHLLYFQRAQTGSGGWIVSALPGSAQ